MPAVESIRAESRDRAGKGAARATRRAGRVPAVIYGDKKEPTLISLDPKELELVVRLRKVVSDMSVVEAMELLRGRMVKTKSNAEFLMTMNLG